MSDFKMRRNPERAAWAVLYGAFFTWCVLAVSLPLGARWWLRNASSDQTITLQSSGTVLVTRPGGSAPEVNLADIPVGSTITTQADSQATLTFAAAEGGDILATVQVYGSTELVITRADRPRYSSTGISPNRIDLRVATGRLRAAISPEVRHPVKLQLHSPPEAVTVLEQPGSKASLEASGARSVIVVREGEALVIAESQGIIAHRDERAEVTPNQPPNGPLPAERDWIVNGYFQQALEFGWAKAIRQPQKPEEDWGAVTNVTIAGRQTVQFLRAGQAWGQAGITQEINRDVRDYTSLRLHLAVLVNLQDLWNCGASGTECPVMVDITFVDKGGGERHWLKGFYYRFNANASFGLTACPSCNAVSSDHERVELGEWTTYDSPNLLEVFAEADVEVVTIKSILIYGAGHVFNGYVTEVELLAEE